MLFGFYNYVYVLKAGYNINNEQQKEMEILDKLPGLSLVKLAQKLVIFPTAEKT